MFPVVMFPVAMLPGAEALDPRLSERKRVKRLRLLSENVGADPDDLASVFLALAEVPLILRRPFYHPTILTPGPSRADVVAIARQEEKSLSKRAASLEREAAAGPGWHRRRDHLDVCFVEAPARQFPLEELLDLLVVAENPRLSARDREALLAAAQGLSAVEAAEELGCSPDAYRQRLRAARAKCRH